jgi:hypothetical protein
MRRTMARERPGLATIKKRRGVTPLVLLLKRSGHIRAKSWAFSSSE